MSPDVTMYVWMLSTEVALIAYAFLFLAIVRSIR